MARIGETETYKTHTQKKISDVDVEGEKISPETGKKIFNEFVLLYTNTPEPQLKIPYLYKVSSWTCNKASFITKWSPL